MNASNRPLGRVLLVVIGLSLVVGGLLTVAVMTLDVAASAWRSAGAPALAVLGTRADRGASVLAWTVALAAAVVVGVLAVVVVATRGGGRADDIVEDDGSAGDVPGSVRIDATAVQHALSSAIGAMPQVASLAVDVYRVRGGRAIRITLRPKRGVAPRKVVEEVEGVVSDLDALLGSRLPVLLRIARGGHGSNQVDRVH